MSMTMHELQCSSDIHQANRELAEGRLRRVAEIEDELKQPGTDTGRFRELIDEKDAILAAAVTPV